MSSGQSKYSFEHILGNTNILRNENPTIRGAIRRADPDGGNSEPHFTGLTGTSLTVDVTPVGNLVINFTSDDLDVALDDINAVSPANLQGFELDGYVYLRNLNGGNKNTLEILSGDAAPLLGFTLSPEPGSKSFAGEIATSPPGRRQDQNNPQGTALIAGDEDLRSDSMNRALAGSILAATRILKGLDTLLPTVKEFASTVVTHAGSGKKVAYVVDADLRIPVNGFGISGTSPAGNELDSMVCVLDANRSPIYKLDEVTDQRARVLDVYFEAAATGSPALDNSTSFAAWGTPDGRSIFGPSVPAKDKQAATAISTIRGGVITVPGALFQTNGVQAGDTAIIESATNNVPYNHDGEYIVTEVLSEEILVVRGKSEFEGTYVTTEKPLSPNDNLPGGTSYGTLRVVVGDYFSAVDSVAFEVPSWVPAGAVFVRCVVAARAQDLGLGDLIRPLSPNQQDLVDGILDHILNGTVGLRHTADQVDAPAVAGVPDSLTVGTVEDQLAELLGHINTLAVGVVAYDGGIDWADTAGDTPAGPTTNPATTVGAQLDKILVDLAGAGIDGAAKIRTLAVTDLTAGNIRSQLNELAAGWLKLDRQNTVTADQEFDDVTVSVGGGNADTKPAFLSTGVPTARQLLWQAQIASAPNTYARIYRSTSGFEFTVNAVWGGATWSSDDSSLNSTRLLLSDTNFNLQYNTPTAGTWADGGWAGNNLTLDLTTFLMTYIGNIDQTGTFDLAGTADLHGQVNVGSNLLSTLAAAATARMTMPTAASGLGANTKTCLFEFGNNNEHWRLYVDRGSEDAQYLELTYNAEWLDDSGTYKWFREDGTNNSAKYRFREGQLLVSWLDAGDASPWIDSAWTQETFWDFETERIFSDNTNSLDFGVGFLDLDDGSGINPSAVTAVTNRLFPKNMVKAWAKVFLFGTTPLMAEGFNINALAYTGDRLRLTFASAMDNEDYVVVAMHGGSPTPLIYSCPEPQQLVGSFELEANDVTPSVVTLDGLGGGIPVYVVVLGEQT